MLRIGSALTLSRLFAIFLLLFALSTAASELEPETIGPTAGNVSFVSTAYAGGKFLTVWRQLFMPTVGIWGAFSDAAGKPLGPSFPIVSLTNAQNLNLFPRGDGFVLVWDDANRSSQLIQIDSTGRTSGLTTIGPPGLTHAYATIDRIVTATLFHGTTIIDFDGRLIRDVSQPVFGAAGAGRSSFLGITGASDLKLIRYSSDGQSLQQWTLMAEACKQLFGCWFVVTVRELDSGSILVVLANSDRRIQTVIAAPDGTVSAPVAIPMTLLDLWRASLEESGSHLWLFLAGAKGGGATRVEATELDQSGTPIGPLTTVVDTLAGGTELLAFAEGPGMVFAATSPTTADRQVQTFAFRSLAPVAPEVISTTASIQANTQIASNGAGFLAVWNDTNGTRGSRLHWAAVDALGHRTGAIFEGGGTVVRKSLVTDGLDYLVLLRSPPPSSDVIARRLAADGTLLGDTRIPDASVQAAAAVATANGYIIVWVGGNGSMHSMVLTSNGVAGPVQNLAPPVPSLPARIGYWTSPVLAWDGSAILLAAEYAQDTISVAPASADTILTPYAMLLTSDGVLLSGSETPLDPAFLTLSAAASSGSDFLLAGSAIVIGHREGTRLRFSDPLRTSLNADVVWNGSAYVVARVVQGTAMVTLVARDGSILATTFRRGPEDLDVSVDATGRVVIAGVESDGSGPLRAISYAASELQPLVTGRSRAASH